MATPRKAPANPKGQASPKDPAVSEKEESPPRKARLEVDFPGQDGEYLFAIQVMTHEGSGLKAIIRITEGTKTTEKPTNENGFLEFRPAPFKESEKEFTIRVISGEGTGLNWIEILDGPREKRKKKERPKIKQVSGGFMANFRNVIGKNRKK